MPSLSTLYAGKSLLHRQSFLGKGTVLRRWWGVAGLALLTATQGWSQFATGFETSQSTGTPGYSAGSSIIGVRDATLTPGHVWTNQFGTNTLSLTLTTSNPASGSQALQIKDLDGSAYGAYLWLAGTNGLDMKQPFTAAFSMNLSAISAGTGNQAQVYFGVADTNYSANKYWFILMYNNGALELYVNNATGNGHTTVSLGNYSDYDTTGSQYVQVSISIDPQSKKYTRVILSSAARTTDCTAAVQAVNGGVVPWLPAANSSVPATNLLFVTGSNDTLVAKFDQVSVTNSLQWFEAYAPGVILPDQGTVQMTLSLSRPVTQFGNSYDYAFQVMPALPVASGKSLMGVFIPGAGYPTQGLNALIRNATTTSVTNYTGFSSPLGQLVRVAMTWGGGQLRLYVNGTQVASSATSISQIAPLPAFLRVQRLDPFNVSELKISDIALATGSLSGNPATPLTADANTTLLVTEGLTRALYPHTARQGTLIYSSLTPMWRVEDQCLVEGTTPTYTLLGINHSGSTKTYSVAIQATDRLGAVLLNSTQSVAIVGDNVYHPTTLTLSELAGRGYYKLQTTVTNPSGVATVYASAIAVLPANEASVDGAWDRYLGHHFPTEDYSPAVLTRLGIKTSRQFGDLSGFMWYAVQPNEGTGANGFTWARADQLVERSKAAGVELVGILGNPPPWAAVDPGDVYKNAVPEYTKMSGRWKPRSLTEWGNYVYQVVSRYKNDVKCWEIMNEVDYHPPGSHVSAFSGTTQDYFNMLQTAYTQAKAADPTCSVLMSGFSLTSTTDLNMPYDLLNLGAANYFDVFAQHAYDTTRVDQLQTALTAKKPGSANWMTEQMWDSVTTEADRMYLTPYLYLYYLEKGIDRFYQFGFPDFLFNRNTLSPQIDTYWMGVFQSQMRKADGYVGKYTASGLEPFAIRHQLLRKDGKTLSLFGAEKMEHVLTVSGTLVSAIDAYGKPLTTTVSGGTTVFYVADVAYIVSNAPLSITGVELKKAAPLYVNGDFECITGDLQTGGLAVCTPMNWTLRKSNYDPQGQINLTTAAHGGSYALTMSSSGAGKVYVFQDVHISSPGRYRLTAYVRRTGASETAIPFLQIFNRDAGTFLTQSFSGVVAGGNYTQVSYDVTFSQPLIQYAAIMCGIYSGAGTLLLDDVTFTYLGP